MVNAGRVERLDRGVLGFAQHTVGSVQRGAAGSDRLGQLVVALVATWYTAKSAIARPGIRQIPRHEDKPVIDLVGMQYNLMVWRCQWGKARRPRVEARDVCG